VSNILKEVTIDMATQTIQTAPLDLAVPDGHIVSINAVGITVNVKSRGTTAPLAMMAAVTFKDLFLPSLTNGDVMTHSGVLAYGSIELDADSVSADGRMVSDKDLVVRARYGYEPTVVVGGSGAVSGSGRIGVLFNVDYDFVKLTQKIAIEVSTYT